MGQAELEAALRKGGEDKARAIWTAVEAEAERLRSETGDLLQREELVEQSRCKAQSHTLQVVKQTEAEQAAQRCRLVAEAALAERLLSLTAKLLEEMTATGGEDMFRALAAEIPDYGWFRVRVNPRDQQLAADCFPLAQIEAVVEIVAGLEIQDREDQVRIINTLEKRCEHLWPELLPEMMAELRQMAGEYGTAG